MSYYLSGLQEAEETSCRKGGGCQAANSSFCQQLAVPIVAAAAAHEENTDMGDTERALRAIRSSGSGFGYKVPASENMRDGRCSRQESRKRKHGSPMEDLPAGAPDEEAAIKGNN